MLFVCCAFAACSGSAGADPLSDAFTEGHPSIEVRPRVEIVDQATKKDATAFTVRTLLGFATNPIDGFSAMVQVSNVVDLTHNYNSNVNGKTHYATIPDPPTTRFNQAYLKYAGLQGTEIVAGRQIINLDDTRFVGNVDFRQTMQTFDAATVTTSPLANVKFVGSYAWQLNNILGRRVPTDILLAEAYWAPLKALQGEAFGYWYADRAHTVILGAAACNLAGPKACNSATYGFRVHGTVPLDDEFGVDYRGAYAKQDDFAGGSTKIDADYWQIASKLNWTRYFVGVEYMVMGSNANGTYGFQTPLATKHAFNGWAEIFLTTPPKGLDSLQFSVGGQVLGVNAVAKYYQFRSDFQDQSYGHEWDLSLVYPLSPHWQFGIEYANYRATGFGLDTEAGWAFVTMRY
jgi:hypothetical protein